MSLEKLYADHVAALCERYAEILCQVAADGPSYDGIVFHAGAELLYHDDDQPMPFRRTFHFARWVPVPGPDHLVVFRPGKKPRLIQVVPRDYWYEPPAAVDHPYPGYLDVEQVEGPDEAIEAVGEASGLAYVGADLEVAMELGLGVEDCEPEALMARLDWDRGLKTPYEVECIRRAVDRAAVGHATVRAGAELGHSERALHLAYLAATGHLETEVPYTNIVGWNEHAAVLHYQSKSPTEPGSRHALLLDAGADHLGYASDVTRTYPGPEAHEVFVEICRRLDGLQRDLVSKVAPGVPYVDLHEAAHHGMATILSELGVIKASAEQALERGLTDPFFPHGLGHHLGLQVHDVGGRQSAPEGGTLEPPERYPFLRTTRTLQPGHVVTVEPGIYFIPLLLEPWKGTKQAGLFHWDLIEQLKPCGGVRIEDDVLCTEDGFEDLSRPRIPGHLEDLG